MKDIPETRTKLEIYVTVWKSNNKYLVTNKDMF